MVVSIKKLFDEVKTHMEGWRAANPAAKIKALTIHDFIAVWVFTTGASLKKGDNHDKLVHYADLIWEPSKFTSKFNESMRNITVPGRAHPDHEWLHYHLGNAVEYVKGANAHQRSYVDVTPYRSSHTIEATGAPLYRGQGKLAKGETYAVGTRVQWKEYNSTSTSRESAEELAGKNGVMITILGARQNLGAVFATTPPLSVWPDEGEILLPAGATFNVLKHEKIGKVAHIELEHVGEWRDFDDEEVPAGCLSKIFSCGSSGGGGGGGGGGGADKRGASQRSGASRTAKYAADEPQGEKLVKLREVTFADAPVVAGDSPLTQVDVYAAEEALAEAEEVLADLDDIVSQEEREELEAVVVAAREGVAKEKAEAIQSPLSRTERWSADVANRTMERDFPLKYQLTRRDGIFRMPESIYDAVEREMTPVYERWKRNGFSETDGLAGVLSLADVIAARLFTMEPSDTDQKEWIKMGHKYADRGKFSVRDTFERIISDYSPIELPDGRFVASKHPERDGGVVWLYNHLKRSARNVRGLQTGGISSVQLFHGQQHLSAVDKTCSKGEDFMWREFKLAYLTRASAEKHTGENGVMFILAGSPEDLGACFAQTTPALSKHPNPDEVLLEAGMFFVVQSKKVKDGVTVIELEPKGNLSQHFEFDQDLLDDFDLTENMQRARWARMQTPTNADSDDPNDLMNHDELEGEDEGLQIKQTAEVLAAMEAAPVMFKQAMRKLMEAQNMDVVEPEDVQNARQNAFDEVEAVKAWGLFNEASEMLTELAKDLDTCFIAPELRMKQVEARNLAIAQSAMEALRSAHPAVEAAAIAAEAVRLEKERARLQLLLRELEVQLLAAEADQRASGSYQPSAELQALREQIESVKVALSMVVAAGGQFTHPTKRCRAVHTWDAAAGAGDGDLVFRVGDEFELVSEEHPGHGWMTGRRAGIQGTFPCNYVEVFENKKQKKKNKAADLPVMADDSDEGIFDEDDSENEKRPLLNSRGHSAEDFAIGVPKGTTGLVSSTVEGVFVAPVAVADALAEGLGQLGSDSHAAHADKVHTLAEGLQFAGEDLKHDLYMTTTSIAREAYHGAVDGGAVGFVTGLGKGVGLTAVGAVSTAVDLTKNLTAGLSHTLSGLLADELETDLTNHELEGEDEELQIKGAFSLFDEDGDGTISTEDLGTVMRTLGQSPTEAELQELIKKVPAKDNGRIRLKDFGRVMTATKVKDTGSDEELIEAFKDFAHGNDSISARDLRRVMINLGEEGNTTTEEVDGMIHVADVEGKDGLISYEEFAKMETES